MFICLIFKCGNLVVYIFKNVEKEMVSLLLFSMFFIYVLYIIDFLYLYGRSRIGVFGICFV